MYTLLIPKKNSLKEKKSGRNGPFWQSFWENRVAEDPQMYREQYLKQKRRLEKSVTTFEEKYKEKDKTYYIEAKLDDFVTGKSKEPQELWNESGVRVVESRKDGTITLSGRPENFSKLRKLLTEASFEVAATKNVTKAQNLSREIFSVTALVDKNVSYEKRTSSEIKDFLILKSGHRTKCVLTIYYERPFSEYDDLYVKLIKKVSEENIEKIDKELFVSNMSFYCFLTAVELQSMLEDEEYNFISFVNPVTLFGAQRTLPHGNSHSLEVGDLITNEKVVVIDSGVDHTLLNKFVIHRENLIKGKIEDKNHGTSTTST